MESKRLNEVLDYEQPTNYIVDITMHLCTKVPSEEVNAIFDAGIDNSIDN